MRWWPWFLAVVWLTVLSACDDEPRVRRASALPGPRSASLGRPRAASTRASRDAGARSARALARTPSPEVAREVERPSELDVTAAEGARLGPYLLDALADVSAAGPATATGRGVLLFDRDNRLFMAPLSRGRSTSRDPVATPIAPLPTGAGPFPLARGPAVRAGFAYWVSRGRLLRQRVSRANTGEPPRVLAEDARAGTRVAVPIGEGREADRLPEVVAYIARSSRPEAPLTAQLWMEGLDAPLLLTADLSSATSVALVATPGALLAVYLEARTGMSSVHQRVVAFGADGRPALGDDVVVWVGGPARGSTELDAQPAGRSGIVVHVPMERDVTHFGLLSLSVPKGGAAGSAEPSWWLYDNGIEPAPVASASACGSRIVVLARPSSGVPRSPQELVLRDMDRESGADVAILARSRAFFDVSLASTSSGALLTYVADHRTWARTLRCA